MKYRRVCFARNVLSLNERSCLAYMGLNENDLPIRHLRHVPLHRKPGVCFPFLERSREQTPRCDVLDSKQMALCPIPLHHHGVIGN